MKHLLFGVLLLICHKTFAQEEIVLKAGAFIALLSDQQKSKSLFKFGSPERFNWHFVPKERQGISLHNLNTEQRTAAYQLLKTSLSSTGYSKATAIVTLEDVLRELEKRGPSDNYRDPLNYHFSFFGNPDMKAPWGWRFEGHHISFNFAASNGVLQSCTPTFMGSNPAVMKTGPRTGTKTLKDEMDLGFALINALSAEQVAVAKFSEAALPEILSFNNRKAAPLTPVGILYSDLTPSQQKIFLQLLDVYVSNYELGFAKTLMAKIKKAGVEKLSFGWAGSTNADGGQYYRIQGPMLLIEYDNTQNGGNHVHTAVRDLTNDFAEDILRDHYQKEHQR
jgi:Protein of unknown function (DUF3500)